MSSNNQPLDYINDHHLLNFNTGMTIANFIFTYLQPKRILNRNEVKKYNYNKYENIKEFYNSLKNKNLTLENIANLIDEDELNEELKKDYQRSIPYISINNYKIKNNSKENKINYLTNLNEKLKKLIIETLLKNEASINTYRILIKNTLFQVVGSIYFPDIIREGLFKIYPFLNCIDNLSNNFILTKFIGIHPDPKEEIKFNIFKKNNQLLETIEIDQYLIIQYSNLKGINSPLNIGEGNTIITINYTENEVSIHSETKISKNYKDLLNIFSKFPELPRNIFDLLLNEKLIDNTKLFKIINNFIINHFNRINDKKIEYYLNFLIKNESNREISKNYNILIEILYGDNIFSENTLDLLLNDNLINNYMILLILKELKDKLVEKEKFEYYLNLIIDIELNNYSLFIQLDDIELERMLKIIFNNTFYSLNLITELNVENNRDFILNIIEVTIINSSNKICEVIVKSSNNLKHDIYIKWNNNLILDDNIFQSIKMKYHQRNNRRNNILRDTQKIKENNLIKINYMLLKLISENKNNKLLLYFYNEILIIFIENNIKEEDFMSFLFSYFDRIETIINTNINIYSKIISIIKIIYEYINLFYHTSEEKNIRVNLTNPKTKIKNIRFTKITLLSKIQKNEYNILDSSLRKTIYNYSFKPINNYQPLYNSDFLIISYNEGNKIFNYNDCLSMLYKVMIEKPSIIIVCTQESATKNNYQDYLKEVLEFNTKLEKDKTYIQVSRIDASTSFKNVKTTVFIRNNSFLYIDKYLIENKKNNCKKFIYKKHDDSKYKYQHIFDYQDKLNKDNILNKYILKEYSYKLSKNSGLGKVTTFFKGSIFLELIIEKNNKEYKFIIINSHLYYQKSGNTGLKEREKEFIDLINEFKLSDYFNKGYNIFFCGDLNFRLNSFISTNNKDYNKISKDIINSYFKNNKNTFKKKYINKEELTKKINFNLNPSLNSSLNENTVELLIKFYTSIMKTGYHLTCKYKEEENNYNKEINNKIKENNIEYIAKKNGIPRIPSMCDRILYAIYNNEFEINTHNFKVYSLPKKSDHKIITLSFELENNIVKYSTNKLSNNKNTIENNNKSSNFKTAYNGIVNDNYYSYNSNSNSSLSSSKSINDELYSLLTNEKYNKLSNNEFNNNNLRNEKSEYWKNLPNSKKLNWIRYHLIVLYNLYMNPENKLSKNDSSELSNMLNTLNNILGEIDPKNNVESNKKIEIKELFKIFSEAADKKISNSINK